jgi:hypothetical protein
MRDLTYDHASLACWSVLKDRPTYTQRPRYLVASDHITLARLPRSAPPSYFMRRHEGNPEGQELSPSICLHE